MFKNRIPDIEKIKIEIDNYRPFPAHVVAQLKEYFRIGLTYTSNALEGNSLTETETKVILEDGLTIGGKTIREHLEAIGHSEAYNLMHQLAQSKHITLDDILELHRLFYYHIDQANAGKYRTVKIIVTGTEFQFPSTDQLPVLMKDFSNELPMLEKTYHPVEYAARAHLRLVTIHPFIDGNGRTARLLMNLALLQHGYAITIIPPIMRTHYFAALRKSNNGDIEPFIDFIFEMVYESHKDYLRLLKNLS